jgi:hypothetical protein
MVLAGLGCIVVGIMLGLLVGLGREEQRLRRQREIERRLGVAHRGW